MAQASALAGKLLHWLFPLTCYHCAEDLPEGDASPLCAVCVRAIAPYDGLACKRCAVPLKDGGARCWRCRHLEYSPLSRLRCAAMFGPELRAVIHAFKYKSRRHLAVPLGGWLADAFERYPELAQADALVPVPLHPSRLRARGFNQAEELAKVLSNRCGIPVRPLLSRQRKTEAQAKLNKEARAANVEDAFVAERGAGMKGKKVLLIDDVATTGATLEACALALKHVGVREVNALVLARQARPTA